MLPLLFLSLAVAYGLLLLYACYRWRKIPRPATAKLSGALPFISVIVVVRNEEQNIAALMRDLCQQQYPADFYEILIVDDHSQDATVEIIKAGIPGSPVPMRLLQLKNRQGKKWGLKEGIEKARGEFVLVTDGDCRLGPQWLSAYCSVFQQGVVFVSGPVTFTKEQNLFEKMQTIEFASLVGTGAVLLEAGSPGMCNAANMGFRKAVYQEVEPMRKDYGLPSGDDEFLLQAIFKRYPENIRFLKSRQALVYAYAQPSWSLLLHQRKRWAGKWRQHQNISIALTALGVFLFHASWLLLLLTLGIQGAWLYFFAGLFVKFLAESLFLFTILHNFGKKMQWLPFAVLQLLHPLYVLFFGLVVNFGGFSWKGRRYNYAKND